MWSACRLLWAQGEKTQAMKQVKGAPGSRSGRSGPSGRPGKSGKSVKSGKSGKSGRSGRSGPSKRSGRSGCSGSRATVRVKQQLLHVVHALLVTTLAKVAGPKAAKQCLAKLGGEVYKHPQWPNHRHGEVCPDLDSTSLYLYEHCAWDALPLAIAKCWLVRLAGNFDGSLETLKLDLPKVIAGVVPRADVFKSFQSLTFDVACPQARMQQWSVWSADKTKYSMKRRIATAFWELTKKGKWHEAAAGAASHETFERILGVRNGFLRKLMLHDLYVTHRWGELDSALVGGGAREVLMTATGFKGKRDSQRAMKQASDRLERLHAWLTQQLQPLERDIRKVLPYGWLRRHTQHACCETRKWRDRTGRGRKRGCTLARQAIRRRRLGKLWSHLGFRVKPWAGKS